MDRIAWGPLWMPENLSEGKSPIREVEGKSPIREVDDSRPCSTKLGAYIHSSVATNHSPFFGPHSATVCKACTILHMQFKNCCFILQAYSRCTS